MKPERWRKVEGVFLAARQRDSSERTAFLDNACGEDDALRLEVESLLRADADASGFMEPPVAHPVDLVPREQGSAGDPQRTVQGELTDRLQVALGTGYRVERELRGGGMSRVFVAEETALKRRVVVKVLPPELAAGLDAERFQREIHLAASLQHPHVVPVHSAGRAEGLFYYTMPFVEGESLREKLEREGPLPVDEAVRLLREITDCLGFAHRRGIIHRDLKPGNILLEEGHALVTDFGIAKALVAATGAEGQALTSTGLILGTPAYMAPEQAVADPTDHRADLYALGCLAYELLTGQPPFAGTSAQALIAAHLADEPEPLTHRRPGISRQLNGLVMWLLEKRPDDRPQSADEVLCEIQTLTVPGRRIPLLGIFGIYVACSLGVLGLAYFAMIQFGLPDWVVPSSLMLLFIGLPIIFATAVLQGGHYTTFDGGRRPLRSVSKHWLTWRRAISGGVLAFAGLGVVVTAYMAMRALGVGPVGTLLAAGVLEERERVLLAAFQSRTRDTLLAAVVTDAFRIDFAQSSLVTLVPPERIAEVLKRMRHPATASLDPALAREVAARDGIRAVMTGGIAAAGPGYLLSAELLSTVSGEVLAGDRETAKDSTEIIPAIDRLSSRLRGRIGESFKSLRDEPPLEQVTTSSLEALRKYSQGLRAGDFDGDHAKAVTLLDEAVALDTGFATAYRTLGVYLGIIGERDRQVKALTKAFLHSERVSERERGHTRGLYYSEVTGEWNKAASAYQAVLDNYPRDSMALINLGVVYSGLRQPERAEPLFRRAIALDSGAYTAYLNLTTAQVALRRQSAAERTFEEAAKRFPDNPTVASWGIMLAGSAGDHRTAELRARALKERYSESPGYRAFAIQELAALAALRGRLTEAERQWRAAMDAHADAGNPAGYLSAAASLGLMNALLRHQPARGLDEVERGLALYRLDSLKPLDRPYTALAAAYASAGKPQRARMLLAEYEQLVEPALRRPEEGSRRRAWGYVALAEGRYEDAIPEFRSYADAPGLCQICGLAELGRAYDRAGEPDSAIAMYERYVRLPWIARVSMDATELAGIYKRLGEQYMRRGERTRARDYYSQFIELWKDCDPELRPQLTEARQRLLSIGDESAQ